MLGAHFWVACNTLLPVIKYIDNMDKCLYLYGGFFCRQINLKCRF